MTDTVTPLVEKVARAIDELALLNLGSRTSYAKARAMLRTRLEGMG